MDNINLENKEELQQKLETLRAKDGFICDMDGVIYHGNRLLPGVKEFVDWLYRENKHFLFLTNSSERSPKELQQKLGRMGLDVDESHFYTSALATATVHQLAGARMQRVCHRRRGAYHGASRRRHHDERRRPRLCHHRRGKLL